MPEGESRRFEFRRQRRVCEAPCFSMHAPQRSIAEADDETIASLDRDWPSRRIGWLSHPRRNNTDEATSLERRLDLKSPRFHHGTGKWIRERQQ